MPLISTQGSTSIHSSREKPASLRPEVNDNLPAVDGHSISDEHVVRNTFINKTAVNEDIYQDHLDLLTTYTEGRIIYITYFSQQFDATDVQSNVVDLAMLTKDDVHIAWTQIRNFELRVKSEFEFNWDYDTNNAEFKGELKKYRNGVLISTENGIATAYDLWKLEDRGVMFIKPQDEVYVGMIIGEHNRDNDLSVNVIRGKHLTNVRASGSDEAVKLIPAKELTLEQMISYIQDDELIEVTPDKLRLRKKYLDPNERKKAGRE